MKDTKKRLNHLSQDRVEVIRDLGQGYFSGYYNESLSVFHLYQFVNLKDVFNAWDPVDDLHQAIQDCAKLSLAYLNSNTLRCEVANVTMFIVQQFRDLQLSNKYLISAHLFPEAMKLISMFADMNVIDYDGYQNIEEHLDGLPDEVAIVIQDRIDRPMLLSGLEEQQYMTRLSAVVASELQYCDIDEFERHLSDVNQFVIMLTGTELVCNLLSTSLRGFLLPIFNFGMVSLNSTSGTFSPWNSSGFVYTGCFFYLLVFRMIRFGVILGCQVLLEVGE